MHDFETALHEEYEPLVRLCTYLTGNTDDADDVAQETLIEAWRNRHKLVDPSGIRPWLSAIARNCHLRWKARQSHQHALLQKTMQVPDETSTFELDLEHQEVVGLLHEALALLPDETRDLLVARFIDSLSPTEIASRLGISENNVTLRLHRGRGALKQIVRDKLPDLEAIGHDAGGTWQQTNLWCAVCGEHKLEGKLNSVVGRLYLRCPACFNRTGELFNATDGLPNVIADVSGFKTAYKRISRWAHDFYIPGLHAGRAACSSCGRPVTPSWVDKGDQTHYQVDASCQVCGGNNFTSLEGLTFALPQSQRFWQQHPRLRLLPFQHIVEVEGQPAVLVTQESVETGKRLSALFGLHSYHFLRVEET